MMQALKRMPQTALIFAALSAAYFVYTSGKTMVVLAALLAASVVLSRYASAGLLAQIWNRVALWLPGLSQIQNWASSALSPQSLRSGVGEVISVSDGDVDGILSELQAAKDELT
jgi:hypothetical protein